MTGNARADECRRCAGVQSTLRLWDGRVYCESCLGRASPKLLAAAGRGEAMHERMPDYTDKILQINWRIVWWPVLAMQILCMGVGVLEGSLTGLLIITFVSPLFLLPFGILYWWPIRWGVRRLFAQHRTRVTVLDGQVWIAREVDTIQFPLSEVRWRRGSLHKLSYQGMYAPQTALIFPKQDVILLSVYGKRRKVKYQAAVGFTEESAEVWRSFLRLAEMPEDEGAGRASWRDRL